MSLKMNIQAAVHIDQLMLKELQKIGWVQYRISLSYNIKQRNETIFLMASNIAFQLKKDPLWLQPSIGQDSHHCYSSRFKMQYINQPLDDNSTFFFKGYIDLTLLDKIQLALTIDLFFSQSYASNYEIIYTYCGKIGRNHNVLGYLPVYFDRLGVLRLSGVFHSALMEFKFQKSEDDSHFLEREFQSIHSYVENLTLGYKLSEIINFYKYYRGTMEGQLTSLQERSSMMSKFKDKEFSKFKFVKLNSNKRIDSLFNELYHQQTGKAKDRQKQQFIEMILQDILSIKALIYQQWNDINALLRDFSRQITNTLREKYEYEFKERLKASIFSYRIKNHDWTFSKYSDNPKSHREQAEVVRKKSEVEIQLWDETFLIQGEHEFQEQSKCIKIFEEIYETGNVIPSQKVASDFQHIVVLVHGFQAHRNDMILLKQCLEIRHKVRAYISVSNIGKTEESIDSCGKRLAIEITKMTEILNSRFKISFIGHSMGGVIIRSALRYLNNIRQHFHAFVSICSPHLGYLYATTKLVQAGLWLINALQKCDSILELTFQDNKNPRECLLYKLTQGGTLNHFNKIAFIASSQDEYVAYQSARVQKNATILTQDLKNRGESDIICEMVDNLLCQVQSYEISRLDVIFCIQQSTLDSFLGRTGHVKFLSDPHFIQQFVINLDHLFL